MKKILSLFVAILMLTAFMVPAFAAEVDEDEEIVYVDENSEVEVVVNALVELYNKIKSGEVSSTDDLKALLDELEMGFSMSDLEAFFAELVAYGETAGVDVADIINNQDLGALQDLLTKFLEDSSINVDALQAYFADSTILSWIVSLYTGGSTPVTTEPEETTEPTDPTEVIIPPTGTSNTINVVVAVVALSALAAGAVIVSKKKEND